MALPLPTGKKIKTISHINDTDTLERFRVGICQTIDTFVKEHHYPPLVLQIGAQGGLLAHFALQAGAHHVTVVDMNQERVDDATQFLKETWPAETYTMVVKHSTALPNNIQYHVVVLDFFHATLQTMACCAWDLNKRGLVAPHGYVLPFEAAMTVRLYHVPELGVLRRGTFPETSLLLQDIMTPSAKLKWEKDWAFSYAIPLSDRVEVLHEVYDTKIGKTVQTWPNQITIMTPTPSPPANECVLLLEWMAWLTPTCCIGNVLASEADLPATVRHARLQTWGHQYAIGDTFTLTFNQPLHFTVAPRLQGGLTLVLSESLAPYEEKTTSDSKLKVMTENTFAKAAMQKLVL